MIHDSIGVLVVGVYGVLVFIGAWFYTRDLRDSHGRRPPGGTRRKIRSIAAR